MWFISRRRHERDLGAARAEAERQRKRADEATAVAGCEVRNRRRIGELNAQLDAAVTRLTGRVETLRRKLGIADAAAGTDHARAQDIGARLSTVHDAAARARKELAATPAREAR
jgi:hypothetical protein